MIRSLNGIELLAASSSSFFLSVCFAASGGQFWTEEQKLFWIIWRIDSQTSGLFTAFSSWGKISTPFTISVWKLCVKDHIIVDVLNVICNSKHMPIFYHYSMTISFLVCCCLFSEICFELEHDPAWGIYGNSEAGVCKFFARALYF